MDNALLWNQGNPNKVYMAHKEVRMLIPEILFIKFKVICVKKKLSVPKQTAELIRKFVEIMENSTKDHI